MGSGDRASIKDTLFVAHRALGEVGIDHALIGGLALGGLGVHRATFGVDLLVPDAERDDARRVLTENGFVLESQTPETLHFSGRGALDILLANRPRSLEMLSRATLLPGLEVKCVRAEDMIGLKIQAYVNNPKRELQDKADIAALIEARDDLDWGRIQEYADLFSQWPAIEELKKQYDV